MTTTDTEQLIESLSSDLPSAQQKLCPFKTAIFIAAGLGVYFILAALLLGLRPDAGLFLTDQIFVFEIALALFMSISAIGSSAFLVIPDMRGHKWLPAIPFTLLGVLTLWSLIRGVSENMHAHDIHFHECLYDAAVLTLIPAFFCVVMTRRGTTTRPFMSAAMNTLAVAGLAYCALRFLCAEDSFAHGFYFHTLPFAGLGALLALFCRRLYRW